MTSTQITAAGTVPAARAAPDARIAVALPGSPFPLGATPGKLFDAGAIAVAGALPLSRSRRRAFRRARLAAPWA